MRQQPAHLVHRIEIAPVIADSGDQPGYRDVGSDSFRNLEIERHRLLDEEGQPGGDGGTFGRAVGEGRHADIERVEPYLAQHRLRIGEGARAEAGGGFLRAGLVRIGDGGDLDILKLFEHAEMPVGDAARADETDPGQAVSCTFGGRLCLFGIERGGFVDHARRGVEFGLPGCGRCGDVGQTIGIRKRIDYRGGEGPRIARGGEPAGSAMLQHLGIAGGIAGDDRQAGRHRLQRGKRQPLEAGGEDEQVGGGHKIRQIGVVAQHPHRPGQAGAGDMPGYIPQQRAGAGQQQREGGMCGEDRGHRRQQQRVILLRSEAPGHQQHRAAVHRHLTT